MDSVIIQTPRFTLRTLTVEDATEEYSRWFDDPVVAEHIVGAKAAHDIAALRDYIAQKSDQLNVLFLGIFEKGTGTHIGNLKFEPIDFNSKYAVLGIMVGDVHWRGRSVASETIHAAGQWLHKTYGISELALGVAKSNVAAQKAYKKSGFIFDHRHYLDVDTATTFLMIKKVDG